MPADVIERGFIGDRHGEYLNHVPRNAEYVMQARVDHYASPSMAVCLAVLPANLSNPDVHGNNARIVTDTGTCCSNFGIAAFELILPIFFSSETCC
jgi:hypothetical protein